MAKEFIQTVTKKWYQSKTLWVMIAGIVLEALNFLDLNFFKDFGMNDKAAAAAMHAVAFIAFVIGAILRVTAQGAVISTLPANTVVDKAKVPVADPVQPVNVKDA